MFTDATAPLSLLEKTVQLVAAAVAYLASYTDALKRGWSPENTRLEVATREELAKISEDPAAFVASLDNREGKGPPVTLPDGSQVERLPGYRRWMWDGAFCGSIGLRWQPGTAALPQHVLGHIGYAVVPWKRRRGYATRALAMMLENARREGLPHVDLTTDPANLTSQKVILANGGMLIERFRAGSAHGDKEELRFRIPL